MLEINGDNLKFDIQEEGRRSTKIRVIGVGGAGSNAVARMMSAGLDGVEFYVLNTDMQALEASQVPNKLTLGKRLTNGLGAGSNPDTGREAALEETERIVEILEGSDMVFITAGLGGGTGTGAAPVIASLARELNALTVAVVTKPFSFEGPRRMRQAEDGLAKLAEAVDTVISIPNDRLLDLVPKGTSFLEALNRVNDVLLEAVQGISDIITTPGLINRDFADIRNTMAGAGLAVMGTAVATGEDAAVEAARQAISSPLFEAKGIQGARGVLINITGSHALTLHAACDACDLIRQATECDEAQVNLGVVFDESLGDNVKITVIATGFGPAKAAAIEAPASVARLFAETAPAVFAAPAPREVAVAPEAPPENGWQNAPAAESSPEPVADSTEAPPAAPPEETPRAQERSKAARDGERTGSAELDLNDLDVPAFLRRGRVLQRD
jgi:cell division protein FtsZ